MKQYYAFLNNVAFSNKPQTANLILFSIEFDPQLWQLIKNKQQEYTNSIGRKHKTTIDAMNEVIFNSDNEDIFYTSKTLDHLNKNNIIYVSKNYHLLTTQDNKIGCSIYETSKLRSYQHFLDSYSTINTILEKTVGKEKIKYEGIFHCDITTSNHDEAIYSFVKEYDKTVSFKKQLENTIQDPKPAHKLNKI